MLFISSVQSEISEKSGVEVVETLEESTGLELELWTLVCLSRDEKAEKALKRRCIALLR